MRSTGDSPRESIGIGRRTAGPAPDRPRPAHDPWRHQGVQVDDEPDGDGRRVRAATIFLTGRECPWRCVMCDLWRYTTVADTPAGAIPLQIASAFAALRARGEPLPPHVKLYNAGSFFDPRAVPPADDAAIAAIVADRRRVIVEAHPSLVGDRTWRFQARLQQAAQPGEGELEVAMGLETGDPVALERLRKHITVEGFALAAGRLAAHGVRLRVFLLVHPPFIAPGDQDAALARSIAIARECGAAIVSLIPTRRGGTPAMDAMEAAGEFRAPRLADLEHAHALALRLAGGGTPAVLADLWDLDRAADCPSCLESRRRRLAAMNLAQRLEPPMPCDACGGSVS